MTSSRRSIFDRPDRRALVVSADRATLYLWRSGTLENSFIFPRDDSGFENFSRYLMQSESMPTYVMLDVVEEEYRHEILPHVRGPDRKAVIARRQQRLFRGTDFCHAELQGRDASGRRDDHVLLMALTNPNLVNPWIGRLLAHKVPIPGIYSLPMVSQQILKPLGAVGRNTLLVSLQSCNGLRQTFFRDRRLKVSRLAPMPRLGTVPFASHLMGELEKLRRYLNSLALLNTDAPLDILILSHGEYLEDLKTRCHDSNEEKYTLLDVADVAQRIGIPGAMTTPYSDALFAYALLDNPPTDHYSRHDDRYFYRIHNARKLMLAAGIAALTISGGLSMLNMLEGLSYLESANDARSKADFYQRRLSAARENLPQTPVPPVDIDQAVALAATLEHFAATPVDMMSEISRILSARPQFEIDRFDWLASSDPLAQVGDAQTGRPGTMEQEAYGGAPFYHLGVLRGRFTAFYGNYRRAVSEVESLAAELSALPSVARVEVTDLPVEIASDRAMAASASNLEEREDAAFALRIVMAVEPPPDGL